MNSFRIIILSGVLNLVLLVLPVTAAPTSPPPPVVPVPATEQVDINTADVATLSHKLSGIGEKKAQAIVDFRKKNGPFESLSDLEKVPGIGPKTLEKNKDKIIIVAPHKATVAQPSSTPAVGAQVTGTQQASDKAKKPAETPESKSIEKTNK